MPDKSKPVNFDVGKVANQPLRGRSGFPVSPEWKAEIQRRCDEIDNNRVELIDGEQVMDELRRRFNG